MKLSSIKTRKQLNEVANMRHDRTKRLFRAATDESKPYKYREKATRIWIEAQKHLRGMVVNYCNFAK